MGGRGLAPPKSQSITAKANAGSSIRQHLRDPTPNRPNRAPAWDPSCDTDATATGDSEGCDVQIDYRCPTHGTVKPLDPKAGVPVCPEMIRRTTEAGVEAEECGQPLTAYLK